MERPIRIILGESFGSPSNSPYARRRAEAVEAVNEMVANGKLVVGHDPGYEPTEAAQLAEAERAIETMARDAVAHMPAVRASARRDVARRCWTIGMQCRACNSGLEAYVDDTDDAETVIRAAATSMQAAHGETQQYWHRRWCKKCPVEDRLIDGLTVRECYDRFVGRQCLADSQPSKVDDARVRLTPAQREAASQAWSAALRAKTKEAEDKERRRIVCDDDRWEVE